LLKPDLDHGGWIGTFGYGPSRHFAASQQSARFRREADIEPSSTEELWSGIILSSGGDFHGFSGNNISINLGESGSAETEVEILRRVGSSERFVIYHRNF